MMPRQKVALRMPPPEKQRPASSSLAAASKTSSPLALDQDGESELLETRWDNSLSSSHLLGEYAAQAASAACMRGLSFRASPVKGPVTQTGSAATSSPASASFS